ncbi:DUF58 domain-containing protein [Brachybacterium saurashtrense]|uniref:DUF58 domain-containing protein n=1 Tax=Brachybacterium saurashtrense TaxID=556288 RepID=A0A345YNM4_9MICO|nr:DUF58 domain-containing protein [Brachybacterium saurashtrense]AXK45526.1 DUF58 domain-containing protein [Brachybacterium saurashtrense]RRR21103.1 DUF58 domain-containing protein [Brachybacterium saurashtrense]
MRISPTPRAALVALFGLPVIVLWPHWWVLVLLAVLWLLVVLVDALLAVDPRRLRVRREAPAQVRLGGTVTGRLLLTNPTGRVARCTVRDAWNPTAGLAAQRASLRVPGQERRAIAQSFTPTRRGEHRSRALLVATRGPWGLARRTATATAPGRFLALHPFGARRHLPSRVQRLREIEGLSAIHQRGQGTEFDSLRDFVDGDDVRSIDWRATARRRSVVVRTWRPERDRHVLIVVDTSRTSAGRLGEATRLDTAFDAALLLTALAGQAGDRVDLLCVDRIPHVSVLGSTRTTVLHDMVAATAAVDPALVETDWERAARTISERSRRGSLVVLITPVEAAAMHGGLLPVAARLAKDHPLVIASVADPALEQIAGGRGDLESVYRAAAAEQARAERDGVSRALERAGAHVVDAPPDRAPQALADSYLALKAAGRL